MINVLITSLRKYIPNLYELRVIVYNLYYIIVISMSYGRILIRLVPAINDPLKVT